MKLVHIVNNATHDAAARPTNKNQGILIPIGIIQDKTEHPLQYPSVVGRSRCKKTNRYRNEDK